MPRLGNRHFSYSPAGKRAFQRAKRKRLGKPGNPRGAMTPTGAITPRPLPDPISAIKQGGSRPISPGSDVRTGLQSAIKNMSGKKFSDYREGPRGFARNKQGELKHPGWVRKRRRQRRRLSIGKPGNWL